MLSNIKSTWHSVAARHSTRRAEAAEAHLRPPPLRRTSADMSGLGGIRTGNADVGGGGGGTKQPFYSLMRPPPKWEWGGGGRDALSDGLTQPFFPPQSEEGSPKMEEDEGGEIFEEGRSERAFSQEGKEETRLGLRSEQLAKYFFSELIDAGGGDGVLHIFGTILGTCIKHHRKLSRTAILAKK